MMVSLYDRVLLDSGEEASIVEVLDPGKMYVADIDKSDGDTETDFLQHQEIKKILN